MNTPMLAELTRRELARRNYSEYLAYAYGDSWIRTRLSSFLANPSKAPWVADYVDQWTAFPNSRHDDMVDATSQALARMIYSSGEIWEEQEQLPVFDVTRMFDPYNRYGRDYESWKC